MDFQHLMNLFAVAMVSLLAAISPGPDFAIVVRNSLVYSRKSGFWTVCGVGVGLIAHLFYTVVGIALLVQQSPVAYACMKYVGVSYLFYLGVSCIVGSFKKGNSVDLDATKAEADISPWNAFQEGFFTNLLNPKAMLFFLSLFSQFIDATTPLYIRLEYVSVNWVVSIGWFFVLSYVITSEFFQARLRRYRHQIDRTMGGLLVLLGFKMLLA